LPETSRPWLWGKWTAEVDSVRHCILEIGTLTYLYLFVYKHERPILNLPE